VPAETRSLARARLIARAPRIALLTVCGVLTLAGLRAAIAPARPAAATNVRTAVAPASVGPFAEAFVRDYLTWTTTDSGQRQQRLGAYIAGDLDDTAGLSPTAGTQQQPLWTIAAAPTPAGRGRWHVTVLAALPGSRRLTLTIPVAVGRTGGLTVTDYPAITALTARGHQDADRYTTAVDDTELQHVAERATRNYLAGNGPDLQADLAPGAHITTPDTRSRLLSIDETAWQTPDRQLAVLATTQLPDGTRIQTRLHLTVTRQTRWFITAINPQGTP